MQLNDALRSCEGQLKGAVDRLGSIRAEELEAERQLAFACQQENEAGREKKVAKVREREGGGPTLGVVFYPARSHRLTAISHRLTAISHRLTAISAPQMAYEGAVRELQRVQEEAHQQAQSRSRSRSKAGPSSSSYQEEEAEDELATQVDKFRSDILSTQVSVTQLPRAGSSQHQSHSS